MRERSPRTLWEAALGQLELQVTRPNFDTWLRNTVGLRLEDRTLIVGVSSDFASEWLRSRMYAHICKAVSRLAGGPTSVAFEILGAQPRAPRPSANGHLPSDRPGLPPANPDPTFTLQSFVVVPSNKVAYAAARRLTQGKARYNPLIYFGESGTGKSHLLHAIAHACLAAGSNVALLTGEEFVESYASAVRAGQPQTFRRSFSSCDLLLLDDLAFLSTRAASQEQFFHLFNTFLRTGRRIALSIHEPPQALDGISDRLRSRLLAGLTVELRMPPVSERAPIITSLASRHTLSLPPQITRLIARQPYQSIRDLEGAVNRIAAFSELSDTPLSLKAAKQALQPFSPTPRRLTADDILDVVCRHFHLTADQLTGPSRARDVTYARHITMYLLREWTNITLSDIGRLFGGRDHTTVLNAHSRIAAELSSHPPTKTDIATLTKQLRAKASP